MLLLLLSLPFLTGYGLNNAAAGGTPPQLVKLTNGGHDSVLLPDSRFLLGYNTVQGPSPGALAAWTTFSNGTSWGYASLAGSVPTSKNGPQGAVAGCLQAFTACPSLDEGYLDTIVNQYSPVSAALNVFNTASGATQLIPLHSPATPAGSCSKYNPGAVNVVWCNFDEVYATGGGAVGSAPFPHNITGASYPAISNEVVVWSGGQWTQITPNDYQIVQEPCGYQNYTTNAFVNYTQFFDPTVLSGFMAGAGGHVAYAMTDYHFDGFTVTKSGGCIMNQHETSVVMYLDGSPIQTLSFPPPQGNSTFNVQSCSTSRCFGGFVGYTGNLLLYSTYTGTNPQANLAYWVYDKSTGFTQQITRPDLSLTDGGRLLWVTEDATNPGSGTVWVYDPGSAVVASNGTVLHNVYSLGSYPGAQPFGVDGNAVLWYYGNSTSTYLQAYELYDQAAQKGHLLPAVNLAGPPVNGAEAYAVIGSSPIFYDNGLAAWVGGTGDSSNPLAIYVYSVKAAEAGQPSISSLGLGAYGFTSIYSVLASSFSQGWFFIDGRTTSDNVVQVYTVNVTGLPVSPLSSGTSTSSTASGSSSSSQSTTQGSSSSSGSSGTSTQPQSSTSTTTQTGPVQTSTGAGGELIPGVPDLDLGLAVLLALVALGALVYLLKRGPGPSATPAPPTAPSAGGEVMPSDGAKTQPERDCSKEKLAYDSALARYDEQAALFESVYEAFVGGTLDRERANVFKTFTDLNYTWYDAEDTANAYADCLRVPRSQVPIPPPPIFPGQDKPTVHPEDDERWKEEPEDETKRQEIG